MRPLELAVPRFRSTELVLDWRGRRLVGIVGPIGAGKSSILDAIAFALYGKTPGVGSATRSLIHQLCSGARGLDVRGRGAGCGRRSALQAQRPVGPPAPVTHG